MMTTHIADKITAKLKGLKGLSQIAQIVQNVEHFEIACNEIEQNLASLRHVFELPLCIIDRIDPNADRFNGEDPSG